MATKIKFDERNYRKHSKKNKAIIKKSLSELGAGRSILLDNEDSLIAGNGVYEQAQALGIPVRVIETDGSELIAVKRTDLQTADEKRRKLALADNVASDLSEFDVPALQADWSKDALADWGVELPEIEETEPKEAQEDDFDEEKDKVETVCKKGDIWQLGDHKLLCGDSTKPDDIARLLGDEKADLWITDPPYNVNYEGGTDEKLKIANDNMNSGDFFQFLKGAFSVAEKVLKKGCSFYIWYASREHVNFETALNAAGLTVREQLIWNKSSLVLGRFDYHFKHEPCLYGWKDGASHRWFNDRAQTTVMDFEKPRKNDLHPTMKPVPLFAYQIANSSERGDIVLDTFGGSGTTIIACEQLGRKCYMMELDPHYCDVIIARWEKFTGQKAIKL